MLFATSLKLWSNILNLCLTNSNWKLNLFKIGNIDKWSYTSKSSAAFAYPNGQMLQEIHFSMSNLS